MNNEQKKEIEFLKKRISILENELKEKDKKNDAVWPAAAAQRKRVAEFCKAHNITPTEAERKNSSRSQSILNSCFVNMFRLIVMANTERE